MKLQDCPPPSNPIFRRWRWYSLIYPRTMALKIISVHTRVEGSFTATCTGPIATVLSLPHGFQLSFFFLPGMRCGAPVETGVLSLGPMDRMSTKWTVYSSATGRQNGAVFSRFREFLQIQALLHGNWYNCSFQTLLSISFIMFTDLQKVTWSQCSY